MAEGYVHIMLVGEDTKHVTMALADPSDVSAGGYNVKRVYLLHSPDETVNPGPKKRGIKKFKKIATELRDDLNDHYDNKFPIKLIPINAFDTDSIIDTIVGIIFKEYPDRIVTKKHIVINVTGGTNLMAVAAMIAAGSQQTGAYYILDKRFNPNLESYVRTIEIPNFKKDLEMGEKYGEVLNVINNNTFRWEYEPRNEVKTNVRGIITYKVKDSIVDTEWMEKRKKPGTIKETELTQIMLEKHNVPPSTTRGRLKQLAELGMISRKKNCPLLTPEKGDVQHRYREYKINDRDNLITIQPAGQAQLRKSKTV